MGTWNEAKKIKMGTWNEAKKKTWHWNEGKENKNGHLE